MKQRHLIAFICLSLLNNLQSQKTDNVITFFIDEYPEASTNKTNQAEIKKICTVFDLKTSCDGIEFPFYYGIFATYAGYLGLSDFEGQISFPRKTQQNSINLLVSNNISPVFMLGNTIAYWEIKDPSMAKMYKIEKKHDEELNIYYWNVQEKALPKNNRVPIHTIVIFANPESIFIPIGVTPTKPNSQFILPTIYAKNDYSHLKNSLFLLKIKPFFSSVKKLFKDIPLGHEMLISP